MKILFFYIIWLYWSIINLIIVFYNMLGIFDSWFWWLQTLKYLKNEFPEFDYIFYADTKNLPYWDKNPEDIKKYTYEWINTLFENDVKLVILACNTASAYAVRSWQTEFPEKKVLSVTIPWVEAIIEWNYQKIWIFATHATVKSNIFPKKHFEITWTNWNIHQIWCPNLVNIIEEWIKDKSKIEQEISNYIKQLPDDIEALILWCTHFPILNDYIKKVFNKPIIDPAKEAIIKLKSYFERHPEIYDSISKNWKTEYIITWDKNKFFEIWKNILS